MARPVADPASEEERQGAWRLPTAVAAIVARLPQLPPSAALAATLGLATRKLADPRSDMLERRVVRFVVADAGLTLTVRRAGKAFVPAPVSAAADVTLTASLRDFYRLAAREEDPDTLFFARRLCIEGDTEAGLAIKNLLDAVDSPLIAWLARVRRILPVPPRAGSGTRPRRPARRSR
jgi:predicted lipid carrier protein YhbT